MRENSPLSMLQRRVVGTLLPAVIGAVLGYLYARFTLTEKMMSSSSFPALYGCMGAISAILVMRLATIFRSILGDYLGRKSK